MGWMAKTRSTPHVDSEKRSAVGKEEGPTLYCKVRKLGGLELELRNCAKGALCRHSNLPVKNLGAAGCCSRRKVCTTAQRKASLSA